MYNLDVTELERWKRDVEYTRTVHFLFTTLESFSILNSSREAWFIGVFRDVRLTHLPRVDNQRIQFLRKQDAQRIRKFH